MTQAVMDGGVAKQDKWRLRQNQLRSAGFDDRAVFEIIQAEQSLEAPISWIVPVMIPVALLLVCVTIKAC